MIVIHKGIRLAAHHLIFFTIGSEYIVIITASSN